MEEASPSHALENWIMSVSEAMLAIHLGNNEERSCCLFLNSYIFFVIFIFLRWIKTNQANQRWRMEKCDNDRVFSFIAEVSEIFLKQLSISKSQHLFQLMVLFSTSSASACPFSTSYILSLSVFFKWLYASIVLILTGKIGLLSIGLLSVSLCRNRSSANSRVWLYFLFVYVCRTICLCLYMFAGLRKGAD